MKEFTMLENYKKQGQARAELLAKYGEKERAAGQHIQDLKAQLKAVISEEIRSGKDASKRKQTLQAEITEAERALALIKEERTQAVGIAREMTDTITKDDVGRAYIEEYLPAVRDEELTPLVERMKEARALYYNTLLDLIELQEKYAPLEREMLGLGGRYVVRPIVEWDKLPQITSSDLYLVQTSKQLPEGIERK